MTDLEKAKNELKGGSYTCVIISGDKTYTSRERGVKPLVRLIEDGCAAPGASAADKVVGRATAFLYSILGVRAVYADVMSRKALDALRLSGINAEYGSLVENIINRSGDGICPFEEAVLDISEPDDAYSVILNKMKEMNISV